MKRNLSSSFSLVSRREQQQEEKKEREKEQDDDDNSRKECLIYSLISDMECKQRYCAFFFNYYCNTIVHIKRAVFLFTDQI